MVGRDPFTHPHYSSDEDEDFKDDCKHCFRNHDGRQGTYGSAFFRDSTIHGFKFIGQTDNPQITKVFWIAFFIISVGITVYLTYFVVLIPLSTSPVIIAFQEEEVTVDQVPFPALTVCTSSKRKTSVFFEKLGFLALHYVIYPNESSIPESEKRTRDRLTLALSYLVDICRDSESFKKHFEVHQSQLPYPIPNITHELEVIFNDTKEAIHQCNEIFLQCLWAGSPISCKGLFFPILTEYGHCCTTNMMPQFILRKEFPYLHYAKESKRFKKLRPIFDQWENWNIDKHLVEKENDSFDIPKHQRKAGMTAGLSLLLDSGLTDSSGFFSDDCDSMDGEGFKVQVHSPIEYPQISDFGTAISTQEETFLDVRVSYTLPSEEVRKMDRNQRHCYYHEEYKLSSFTRYTQKNCIDECIMKEVNRVCHCVRLWMPRRNETLCSSDSEYNCVKTIRQNIKAEGVSSKLCEHCWPSCTQLAYSSRPTSLPLRDDIELWKHPSKHGDRTNGRLALIHVFFSKDTVESKTRKALYDGMEILAKAGGLLGLTLGFSFVSVFEPCFHFTFGLWFRRKNIQEENKKATEKTKTQNTKNKISTIQVRSETKNDIFGRPQVSHISENSKKITIHRHIPREWFWM